MTRRDVQGRRYLEVLPFADGPIKQAYVNRPLESHCCIECGVLLVHGTDRYFQRNDSTDGTQPNQLERALMALTYDPVCGLCGDRALAAMATNEGDD
jgi:hypothetical protein